MADGRLEAARLSAVLNAIPSLFEIQTSCDCCSIDLTTHVHIECTVCDDFHICVDCFANGAEEKTHKKTHPYKVLDALSAPLISANWSGDDELLLIEGIEKYGFGNWGDISFHVGTKDETECKYHYLTCYLNRPNQVPTGKMVHKVCHPPASFDSNHVVILPSSNALDPDLAGYMPSRDEYEKEFDHNAEQLIKDLVFLDDDTVLEKRLKHAMIEIYNARLRDRESAHMVVREHGLIDSPQVNIDEKWLPFARYCTNVQLTSLVDGLEREACIIRRIQELSKT